jgi:hypothetical protein
VTARASRRAERPVLSGGWRPRPPSPSRRYLGTTVSVGGSTGCVSGTAATGRPARASSRTRTPVTQAAGPSPPTGCCRRSWPMSVRHPVGRTSSQGRMPPRESRLPA